MDIQQYIDSLNLMLSNRWSSLLFGIGITLLLNVVTISVGLLLGAGMFLWRYSESKPGVMVTEVFRVVLTYIPPANWLLLVFYIIFRGRLELNLTAALVALSILFGFCVFSTAYDALEKVSSGEKEAVISMGYSRYKALVKIYIPRAMPYFLDGLKGCVRAHIQNTAFAELIYVADVQFVSDAMAAENPNTIAPLLLSTAIYVLLEIICDKILNRLMEAYRYEKPSDKIEDNIKKGKF
ncbi:MAG: ABC transporter permease subunit [Lachnospiraceae bacterium]|nr:ABC transporter permease subunit [Lachnospiraceae bacterium]